VPHIPARLPSDREIDELLCLAHVSTADTAARRWLGDALAAAQAIAAGEPQPSPAKYNAPLDTIKRTTDRLIDALVELGYHPHAHRNFWRSAAFGPVRTSNIENVDVMSTLKNVRNAAHKPCLSPAVSGKKRCRMHGGAPGSGAPRGNKNALKHGRYTREAIEERRQLRTFLRQSRRLIQKIEG